MKEHRNEIIRMRESTADRNKDYWSKEEREQLADMFKLGDGISEMALHFGRSEMAIFNQLNSMRLFKQGRGHYAKKPKCKCPKCAFFGNCKDSSCEQYDS
ncbi:hypothetical protein D1841_10560 [Neglecta sp. X4]|uniref:hypothetical protein n=1 Tax=unclassified Neglectibacter TaxID=2632164 RepID=UPI00136D41CF|nr:MULTISPECIES: hypothetical protein [unclassified Neglectibacter]NBI18036.1 hypothetical protein [Neglectibacter sp. 59]NBJ73713.1 hypothetical protein [Neglectibacter sp. X4]NCE81646.1 hypothetical protein [Neglectibacter sp. X58]